MSDILFNGLSIDLAQTVKATVCRLIFKIFAQTVWQRKSGWDDSDFKFIMHAVVLTYTQRTETSHTR